MSSDRKSREVERYATIPRNRGREEVRLSLDEFTSDDGVCSEYFSGRLWYKDDQSGEWRPTQKGLTVRRAEIEKWIDALQSAKEHFDGGSVPARSNGERRAPTMAEAEAEGSIPF